jgi:hypothetical protein
MLKVVAALAATVTLGLVSRLCPVGWLPYGKSFGDVLYAVAAYLALALLLYRCRRSCVAPLALGFCVAVECFKLTGIPGRLDADYPLVGWVLGDTFSWHNLACYAVGVAAITTIDFVLLRPKPVANGCSADSRFRQ